MFCGGGGSAYGARDAGVTIAAGIDSWKLAAKVFSDNFPYARTYCQAMESLDPARIRRDIGEVDLILASPECTNHSCARGARPRSEPSRETALQVLRYAKVIKPRWLILENVIYMRPWSRYRDLLDALREQGYQLTEHVLDAADFGVPQRRKRLFILGDRESKPPKSILKRRGRKLTARSILDKPGTWESSSLKNGRRAKATLDRAEKGFSELGHDASFLLVYYGSDGAGGWQPLDVPLRTITTLDRFGLVESSQDGPTLRMLQVSELRRAMGFGDKFILNHGTRRDRIKVLGNGVCPPVMSAVVQALTAPS